MGTAAVPPPKVYFLGTKLSAPQALTFGQSFKVRLYLRPRLQNPTYRGIADWIQLTFSWRPNLKKKSFSPNSTVANSPSKRKSI